MQIVDFDARYIEQAAALARQNYDEAQAAVPTLPGDAAIPPLDAFAENGLGCAALEDGRLVGYLCCGTPFDGAFTTPARGVFCPLHGHGAAVENRAGIYRRLYQAAAQKWLRAGANSHAVALYAHDKAALEAFFIYGFGLRCVDAVRGTDAVGGAAPAGLECAELGRGREAAVAPMRRMLAAHLGESPCFMKSTAEQTEKWLRRAQERGSRLFVAWLGSGPVAFIELAEEGENFITKVAGMPNICGAFCLPQHRGAGVFCALLGHVVSVARGEGMRWLGVDFESFNPTAYGFWLKHFTAYTAGVVRRVDESALP